ncbi:MAG: hypothetical protein ABI613_08235 [Gemmatimonadota bacterium]
MDQSHYLHVLIPGRGQLTLSFPDGVERALRAGRLSPDALAWFDPEHIWISLSTHPLVVNLLNLGGVVGRAEQEPSAEVLELFPGVSAPAGQVITDAELDELFRESAPAPDPYQLPLIPLAEQEHHSEFTQFLARSSERELRRESIRNSGGNRSGEALHVFVTGARQRQEVAGRGYRRWWRTRSRLARAAAVLAIVFVPAVAAGLIFAMRASSAGLAAEEVRLMNESSAGRSGRFETPGGSVSRHLSTGAERPLLVPETDLEVDLEIAEAVTWRPATDFSSEEQILRATRKVDAVGNVISLYRVSSWRLMNGARREGDPWLEPYPESSRIDEVLGVMKSAVVLLDSAATRLHVDGDRLVLDNPSEAERYTALRHRADSLLRAPVELDSFPVARAPRRVVTRLLATLPPAVSPFRVP